MKVYMKSFVAAVALIMFVSAGVFAAEKEGKIKTVNIKTSAICGACKKKIEGVLKVTPGVEEAVLNLNSKNVKVKFDSSKTSAEALRKAIASAGYDADDVKKDEKAFAALPACCQKPMEGDMH